MPRHAGDFFDAMAADYDALEPWYEHLYARLHAVLRTALRPPPHIGFPRALDAGCGTGFQMAVLGELGYAVHGLDLAPKLLRAARDRLPRAALVQGDVEALPYRDGRFAVATCCGSTLSYVDDAGRAVRELARVLEPGGRLLIECEGRWSADLLWAWLGGLLGDRWGYGLAPRDVWRAVMTPRDRVCRLEYPGYGALRLFTVLELRDVLAAAGCEVVRVWGIHSITNLLPSTVLHRPGLGRVAAALYRGLCVADAALSSRWPATRLANSLVVLAAKTPRGAAARASRTPRAGTRASR
jgi:SAM-dependent methyltransferase